VRYTIRPITSPFSPAGPVRARQLNLHHWVPLTDYLYNRPTQAFLWRWGQPFQLSLLGGTCSTADGINDYGHIVGSACLPGETLPHAYFYRDKMAVDLGTFGGVSADATNINLSRQIAGNYQLSDGSIHGFEWQNKTWVDLGSLGGSYTYPFGINSSATVIGQSDVSNDPDPIFGVPPYHGFQWAGGVLTDFGQIFGSKFNFAFGINDAGTIAGSADTAGDLGAHAILWNRGSVQDLTPGNTSNSSALGINNNGQVVGISGLVDDPAYGPPVDEILCPCYGVLWQNGEELFLNDLVPAGWWVYAAESINDRGYILAEGRYNGGPFQHFLLLPSATHAVAPRSSKALTMQERARSFPNGGPRALHRQAGGWAALQP
jgi:probable HAF family extracellular repeat protein